VTAPYGVGLPWSRHDLGRPPAGMSAIVNACFAFANITARPCCMT